MADYKQITSYVDSSLDSFDLQALKAQKRIMEQVQLLVKDIEVDSHGYIKTTISNLQKIAKIKAAISKAVVDDQYKDAVTKLCSQFEEVYKKQMAFYKSKFEEGTIGETAAKKQKLLRQLSVENTIEGLTGSGINAQITDKLSDMLQRSVTSGALWTDMVKEMKAYLDPDGDGTGAFAKYAKTYATTAMGQFTGQNNKLMTDALDTEWYMYVGSDIETTREFCQHLTKKRYIHVSEIPTIISGDIDGHQCAIYKKTNLPQGMIEGTTPENFQVNVGGWNCRHQLLPVAEEAVPADIRAKFTQKNKEEEEKKLYADYYQFLENNKDWIEESMRKAKVIGREQELMNIINGQKDLSYNKYVNAFDRLDVHISREYNQYKSIYKSDLNSFEQLIASASSLGYKSISNSMMQDLKSFIDWELISTKDMLNSEQDRIRILYRKYENEINEQKREDSKKITGGVFIGKFLEQTKKWNIPEEDRVKIAKHAEEIEKKLGVKRGDVMTDEQADMQSANPKHTEYYIQGSDGRYVKNPNYDGAYSINCQTCAPAYMLRLMGFNVTAKGNTRGSKSEYISGGRSHILWKELDGSPASKVYTKDWLASKGRKRMSDKLYKEFFEETCREEGVYILTIGWRGGGGHATILQRLHDGRLVYVEPQVYNGSTYRSIDELCSTGECSISRFSTRGIMRVDNKLFDTDYLDMFEAN